MTTPRPHNDPEPPKLDIALRRESLVAAMALAIHRDHLGGTSKSPCNREEAVAAVASELNTAMRDLWRRSHTIVPDDTVLKEYTSVRKSAAAATEVQTLTDEYRAALEAAYATRVALQKATLHPRDFYPLGEQAFDIAREERLALNGRLDGVIEDLEKLVSHFLENGGTL